MMNQSTKYDRYVRISAIITLAIFFLYGILITCIPLLPFWIDEWLLIDNLKFKSSAQLWNALDHTQQFPRVYLQLIKAFSAACDYSYTSLRLPSFLAHTFGLAVLYKLSRRIFGQDNLSRFLWVMIYVSFSTSIHYFVQLKQHTMEMALSLVGIWQLLELFGIASEQPPKWRWFLLCASFAAAPFFSYTYPIVIAPVYLIIALRAIRVNRLRLAAWLPLCIGIASIIACYQLDIKYVLADKGMQDFWQELLMKTFSIQRFFTNAYMMFCNLGSGDLFGNIFGVLGVTAFLYSSYATIKTFFLADSVLDILLHYSCILIWAVLGLFIAGKLPLGTFRLNSFVVPAVGIMIVNLLLQLSAYKKWKLASIGISVIIFLASTGNVYVTMAELGGAEHAKKLRIYHACERAIRQARQEQLPVLVTSAIAYPFDDRWPGDWILKTHPCYKVYDPIAVYSIPNVDSIEKHIRKIPALTGAAIVLDGDSVRTIRL